MGSSLRAAQVGDGSRAGAEAGDGQLLLGIQLKELDF